MKHSRKNCELVHEDHEMFIRFVNGSTWQCIGSDSVVYDGSGSERQLPELFSQNMRWQIRRRGRTTGQSSKKTMAGRRSSLLPEDAIIVIPCFNMQLISQTGSANCSPQKILAHSPTKLLPKP